MHDAARAVQSREKSRHRAALCGRLRYSQWLGHRYDRIDEATAFQRRRRLSQKACRRWSVPVARCTNRCQQNSNEHGFSVQCYPDIRTDKGHAKRESKFGLGRPIQAKRPLARRLRGPCFWCTLRPNEKASKMHESGPARLQITGQELRWKVTPVSATNHRLPPTSQPGQNRKAIHLLNTTAER